MSVKHSKDVHSFVHAKEAPAPTEFDHVCDNYARYSLNLCV